MKKLALLVALVCGLLSLSSHADDMGKQAIGKLKVSVLLGSNGSSPADLGPVKEVSKKSLKSLPEIKGLKFKHYYMLGSDQPNVLRSYKNWAAPLKKSKAILLSFEPVGKPADNRIKLDLNLWQNKKKIMKSAATLSIGKPLYIRGPQWKDGYLIIMVELTSLK